MTALSEQARSNMIAEPQMLSPSDANTTTLYRLVYMSQCVLPDEDRAYADAIDALLRSSRDWNKSHDITGALLFSSGYFAQVLEGAKPDISALAGNIVCDTRHRDIRLLGCGPVPNCLFGNWSMAYTDGAEQFDLVIMDVLGLPNVSQGATLLRMLRHLVMPDKPVD